MKKSYFFGVVMSIVLFSSCASYRETAPILSVNGGVSTYAEADIDYASAKRVSATIETQHVFGISTISNGNKQLKSANRYKSLSKREAQALYKAKKLSGADLILDPEFESEKHSYFFGAYRNSITKLTGRAVKIKGIKEDKHVPVQ